MVDLLAFYNSNVWLLKFFVNPEIAKPLSVVAIEGHIVSPCLRNVLIVLQDKFAQGLKATFYRFFLLEKIVINFAKHTIVT